MENEIAKEIKEAIDDEIENFGTELTGQFREGWIAGMRLGHVIALKHARLSTPVSEKKGSVLVETAQETVEEDEIPRDRADEGWDGK